MAVLKLVAGSRYVHAEASSCLQREEEVVQGLFGRSSRSLLGESLGDLGQFYAAI